MRSGAVSAGCCALNMFASLPFTPFVYQSRAANKVIFVKDIPSCCLKHQKDAHRILTLLKRGSSSGKKISISLFVLDKRQKKEALMTLNI